MQLTLKQVDVLKRYQGWREKGPTFAGLMLRLAPSSIALLMLSLAAAVVFEWAGIEGARVIMVAFWTGFFVTDLFSLRNYFVTWPVLARIIDWSRVEEGLRNHALD